MDGGRLALPSLSRVLKEIRFEAWSGKASLLFYLCAVMMVATLILGGAARPGLLPDAILQLLAIPLLVVSLWRICEVSLTGQMRLALWFCLAIAVLPLLQLIPLPPWLWTALPNRQPSAETFDIMGHALPWMPISVSPNATWLSALSVLPPLAVFLSTLLLSYRERRWLVLIVLAVGVLSVLIGLIQVSQGQASPFRLFANSRATEAVGFFANRNHFAALNYCLMVFALGWLVYASTAVGGPGNQNGKPQEKRYQFDTASIIKLIASFTVLVILLAGELMARSRAGLGLTIIALFGVFALGYSKRRTGFSAMLANKLLLGVIVLVAIFSLQFALYRVLDRIPDPLYSDRSVMTSTTIEAARAYMPLGSGLGSFVPVYAMFEKPEDAQDTYVNRAHNEFLEVGLEAGVLGLALIGLFVVWLVRRSVEIWRSAPAPGASQLDWSLIRAATIVPALLLAHSLFEFPLRTGAMMAIMVFACALLIEPPVSAAFQEEGQLQAVPRRTRRRERRVEPALSSVKPSATPDASEAPPRSFDQRRGAEGEWAKEWSKAAGSKGAPQNKQLEPPDN
jgi:O-antigen ligase